MLSLGQELVLAKTVFEVKSGYSLILLFGTPKMSNIDDEYYTTTAWWM